MCKDCGCSLPGHSHEHTHTDGTKHTHSHSHDGILSHTDKKAHEHEHSHAHPVLNESKTIDVIEKILSANDAEAEHNRAHLDEHKILCVNLMSSPGAGKTTLLEATIKNSNIKIGVVEGDLETNQDADRVVLAGGKAHQITTGQTCHLDAFMVHEGLHHLPLNELDMVFIENVGNLVCPASYDVGSHFNAVLISVPEGDDKVSKYPVMFRAADVLLISKISLLPHFDFDVERVKKDARKLNPKIDIIEIDSKTGEGVQKWVEYLKFKKEMR
ncbi:hydrogenase nickel incorporation protein HypB [Campylobacter sp. RM9344]|uniref:Hydrogenase nickel incorporation protein HypB n=1 Tax=Campylobacter californiensis TaxID=1032243 RepID=A0AAW3ZT44_9BACT|nr:MULTISPECIES: hydrogenase nickel incorporation protein HypB [unclassified Campylobacter]MBE2984282.1 hydrogenase nickel incorporation protein HypB [Campylobacter sp. RM6883]MBE2985963.1 hydrogenase nickel incorporation protein HypB [Campylobacter sp. RM12919]MBE2988164.1 hydrogenase nickel incorporation protein HypB [Campylobacter sp. RM12920]MBE2994851.1 hydrogenase nickel incorporation protein HypB [Campylobacter sp. RM6913]MBE3029373.1 hydrogenase nickel incorporation protein HypB [Campy